MGAVHAAARGAALVVALLVPVACGGVDESARRGQLTLDQARAFSGFPLYYAGERVGGLPLVAIVRREDTADYVSFVYGDCVPAPPEGGCAPPAEIQVWPSRARNPGFYEPSPGVPVPQRSSVRGLPALTFEDGLRLELDAGASTVVVFADSEERVREIADALRCLGRPPPAGPYVPLRC